jgi:endoglucanase
LREQSLEFLRELMEAPSPSGFEQPAQSVVRSYVTDFSDEVDTDVMGNVIASKNGKGKPRVMLAGHVDEIGLIVSYIDDKGYINFKGVGGWDTSVLVGQSVLVHTAGGPVPGVVGRKPIHLMSASERGKSIAMDQLFIDVGVEASEKNGNKKSDSKTSKLVRIGDPVTVGNGFMPLQGDLVAGRCFDDKAGTFSIVEALRLLARRKLDASVFAVSTTQEEVGLRGARTSCFGLDPHVGIAVDVTFASDTPGDSKKKTSDVSIGGGPVIVRGANINPRLYERLIEAAEAKKIPYQLEASPGGTGTDANAMQLTRSGVATALIGVPVRYMHTPVEVLSLKDLENTAKLLAETIARLEEDSDFTP